MDRANRLAHRAGRGRLHVGNGDRYTTFLANLRNRLASTALDRVDRRGLFPRTLSGRLVSLHDPGRPRLAILHGGLGAPPAHPLGASPGRDATDSRDDRVPGVPRLSPPLARWTGLPYRRARSGVNRQRTHSFQTARRPAALAR